MMAKKIIEMIGKFEQKSFGLSSIKSCPHIEYTLFYTKLGS